MIDENAVFKKLSYYAPYCTSLNTLISKYMEPASSRSSIFRFFAKNPAKKIAIVRILASKTGEEPIHRSWNTKKITKKQKSEIRKRNAERHSTKTVDNKSGREVTDKDDATAAARNISGVEDRGRRYDEDTIMVAVKRRPNVPIRPGDDSRRLKIFKEVCDLIAQGVRATDACDIVGMSYATFNNLKMPRYGERAGGEKAYRDMYKSALDASINNSMEAAQLEASQVLLSSLKEKTVVKTTKIGRVNKNGVVTPHTIVQREEIIQPNVQIAKWIAAKTDPVKWGDAADREYHKNTATAAEGNTNPYALRAMTLAEIQAQKQEIANKIASLQEAREKGESDE